MNTNTRRNTLLIVVICVVSLGAFFYLANQRWNEEEEATRAANRAPVKVAMKWTFAGTMAPYFASKTNGVFDEYDLAVELLPGGPTRPATEQVLFGKAQFGITGAHDLALARANDQPLVSIAVIFRESPTCLLSLAESRIKSPEDLKGKIVEMTIGDNSDFEYRAMLQLCGIALDEVDTRKWNFNYDLLLSGRVHATVAYENDQAITLAEQHKISVLAPRKFGVTPYADVLFTTQGVIDSEPDLVARVVSGFLGSWERAAANPEDVVDRFLKDSEVVPLGLKLETQLAVVKKSVEFVRGGDAPPDVGQHIQGIGMQSLARWKETVSLIEKYGDVEKLPDPAGCFSNRWSELYGQMQARVRSQ